MKLRPCVVCGSTKITLSDCGYSSFNYGGGECSNKHHFYTGVGTFPTQKELAKVWNDAQGPTVEAKLRAENTKLRSQIRKMKKGKDNE